jgi:tyrosine-protein kinase Etk/Wzc
MEASNNVVAISGHAPGVGKTFVCANLAALLAGAGKRVLVIDADMRKGTLHHYLGGERAPGLADVVSGQVTLEAATRRVEGCESLYALAGGSLAPNPSELLMSERFAQLLEQVSQAYDLVLIDTPPVLAVADAAVIGRLCGAMLLVVRAQRHSLREILLAVQRLRQNGVRVNGAVLNDIALGRSRYGYVYQYQYGATK